MGGHIWEDWEQEVDKVAGMQLADNLCVLWCLLAHGMSAVWWDCSQCQWLEFCPSLATICLDKAGNVSLGGASALFLVLDDAGSPRPLKNIYPINFEMVSTFYTGKKKVWTFISTLEQSFPHIFFLISRSRKISKIKPKPPQPKPPNLVKPDKKPANF